MRPLDDEDFVAKPWIPYSGWPITKAELDPYYARAFTICGLQHSVFDGRLWPLVGRKPMPVSARRLTQFFLHYSPAVRFGLVYRDELERDPRLLLLTHANATNLQPTEDGAHVAHVDLRRSRESPLRSGHGSTSSHAAESRTRASSCCRTG